MFGSLSYCLMLAVIGTVMAIFMRVVLNLLGIQL